jgi:cytoskeleton protein RodZ
MPAAAPLLPRRVVLRATARSWVEVSEGPDKEIFARLMYPGDTYEVPPRRGFVMSTGNAGGVQILIDGQLLPPLGPLGAVRRDVALDSDILLGNAGPAR